MAVLKRLWTVLTILWAVAFIGNGMTRESGATSGDYLIALAPFVLRLLVLFVVYGLPSELRRRP